MSKSIEYIQEVDIVNKQKEVSLEHFLPFVPSIISAALAINHKKAKYIGVHFVSDKVMRRYHQKYFNDPSPTDCMSFPVDEPSLSNETYLGDIMICPKVAIQSAKKENQPFEKELALYIIHATLHLLGFDDIKEKDRKIMRQKENEALTFLTPFWKQ